MRQSSEAHRCWALAAAAVVEVECYSEAVESAAAAAAPAVVAVVRC